MILQQTNKEIISVVKGYLVIKYYTYKVNEKEYGNIYVSKEEAMKNHPKETLIEGYGYINQKNGLQPKDTPDFFQTEEEVREYIEERYKII